MVGVPYRIGAMTYEPTLDWHYEAAGTASWYGPGFQGRRTANGDIFNQRTLTAAHPTLQLPSIVRVTNLDNGRSVTVLVNDRGPFVDDRLIDVSRHAAQMLGFLDHGTARVRIKLMEAASRALWKACG